MFNMGFTELLVLGAIALLVIGPKQLPELARTLARIINEFKRASGDLGDLFFDTKNQVTKTILDATEKPSQESASSDKKKSDVDHPSAQQEKADEPRDS